MKMRGFLEKEMISNASKVVRDKMLHSYFAGSIVSSYSVFESNERFSF